MKEIFLMRCFGAYVVYLEACAIYLEACAPYIDTEYLAHALVTAVCIQYILVSAPLKNKASIVYQFGIWFYLFPLFH